MRLLVAQTIGIVYEIGDPITAMILNAAACLRWLDRDEPDLDQARRAAKRILDNGRDATGMLDALRGTLPLATPAIAAFDVNAMLGESLSGIEDDLRLNEITLTTAFAPELAPVVGDRVQLRQVVDTLVASTLGAMAATAGRARALHVCTEQGGNEHVLIGVMDAGHDGDPSAAAPIFDPVGLGLPICCSIVERHGGRLWAIADSPHSTAYRFILPQAPEPVDADAGMLQLVGGKRWSREAIEPPATAPSAAVTPR